MTPKQRASHILDLAERFADARTEAARRDCPDYRAAYDRAGEAFHALCTATLATVPRAEHVAPPNASQPRHIAVALRTVLDCAAPGMRDLFPEAFAMVESLWLDERRDMLENPPAAIPAAERQ